MIQAPHHTQQIHNCIHHAHTQKPKSQNNLSTLKPYLFRIDLKEISLHFVALKFKDKFAQLFFIG